MLFPHDSLLLWNFPKSDCFCIVAKRSDFLSAQLYFQHVWLCRCWKIPCWYKQWSSLQVDMKTLTKRFCLKNLYSYATILWSKWDVYGNFPCAITLHPAAERWAVYTMWQPAQEEAWKVIILNETFCCGSIHHILWTLDSTSTQLDLRLHYCVWLWIIL